MVSVDEVQRLLLAGGDVVGPDGRKIGSVGQLFLDARSGEPAWVTVVTGLFGTSESFVPLTDAVARGDDLQVAFDKGRVRHAPRIDSAEGALSAQEERELYRHYGLLHDDDVDQDPRVGGPEPGPAPTGHVDASRSTADDATVDDGTRPDFVPPPIRPIGTPAPPEGLPPLAPPGTPSATTGSVDTGDGAHTAPPGPAGARGPEDDRAAPDGRAGDTPGHGQPDTAATDVAQPADDAMVLRAEQPKVIGSERVPTERVRLRRYTVTEQRTITVPVTREEFRVEYEPAEGGEPLPEPDEDGSGHGRHAAGPADDDAGRDDRPGPRDPVTPPGR